MARECAVVKSIDFYDPVAIDVDIVPFDVKLYHLVSSVSFIVLLILIFQIEFWVRENRWEDRPTNPS